MQGNNPVEDLARVFNVAGALRKRRGCFSLGRRAGGAGKGKPRLVYVTVGTGYRGGIILDGHLYRGADMAHPELVTMFSIHQARFALVASGCWNRSPPVRHGCMAQNQ